MNLSIVQIGSIGHYEYAFPVMKRYGLTLSAAAFPHRDDDPKRVERDCKRFGFCPVIYDDWKEMLERENPDIAILNTVMAWNGEMAKTALSMGISVFCEKPVAVSLDQLDVLIKTYEEAKERFANEKQLIFCGMFGIDYLPHFETAYCYVKSGALGDIRFANAQKSYRMGNRESFYSNREEYGGTIPWVAIHAIEWIERIGGLHPLAVTAYGDTACNSGNGTMESAALCLFSCEGGKMASVSADVMRPKTAPTHDDDRLRLVGSKGILEVRDRRVFVIDENGERELALVQTETELFEEFLFEYMGKGKCRVSAEDTFWATRTALSAREAEDLGKTVAIPKRADFKK